MKTPFLSILLATVPVLCKGRSCRNCCVRLLDELINELSQRTSILRINGETKSFPTEISTCPWEHEARRSYKQPIFITVIRPNKSSEFGCNGSNLIKFSSEDKSRRDENEKKRRDWLR